jgi:predicted nucleotidyltransferase
VSSAAISREAEIEQMIRACLARFAGELRGYRVILFGSRATGAAGPLADFDLGVLGPEPLPLDTFYRVQDALEELPTLYTVDWVDLQRTSPEFRRSALENCRTLYEP